MKRVRNEKKPRARDLGIVFEGTEPGVNNAITDVKGVEVGYSTIIKGDDVRTGVTIIHPRGKDNHLDSVFGSLFVLNGNGDVTGAQKLKDFGFINHPIGITSTARVGIVRDSINYWQHDHSYDQPWGSPIVAETWDGYLDDNYKDDSIIKEHVYEALNNAMSGPVKEGSYGGGTGSICFEYKAGNGTSSRTKLGPNDQWTVGVFVQANCSMRGDLKITGIPILDSGLRRPYSGKEYDQGSIVVIIATDAPLMPNQLKILARHAAHGIARTGALSGILSGDFVIAFSTANKNLEQKLRDVTLSTKTNEISAKMVHNDILDHLTPAVVYATEEAIINALVAGKDMKGSDGNQVFKLPFETIAKSFREYKTPNIMI